MMALGSHNSWSFLPVRRWWMKPLAFTARCQRKTIQEQYALGVRCFDLRVRFDGDDVIIAHGMIEYKATLTSLYCELCWLELQSEQVYVRVIHEVRRKKQYTIESVSRFKAFCKQLEKSFPQFFFWCGRNLYNWDYDYRFSATEPTCEEKYASVCAPKIVDDWWPWLFAHKYNHAIVEAGTDKTILLIDFVDIR